MYENIVIDSDRVSSVLGDAHLINLMNGGAGQKFECFRCNRSLPENMFAILGPRFWKSSSRPLTALHPWCHTCRKQAKGKWISHPSYTPELDRFWKSKFSFVRSAALNRNIFLGIDYEDLLGKYIEQDGLCAISGLKINPFENGGTSVKSGRNSAGASVDRIDSMKHYTPDNIQIILSCVNQMKGELPQDIFIEFCRQISTHQMFK
jgi:hypothetical protein